MKLRARFSETPSGPNRITPHQLTGRVESSTRPVVRPGTVAVHYRPVLDLDSVRAARSAGGAALAEGTRWVEACVRWPAVDGDLLAPGDFGAPALDDAARLAAIGLAVRDSRRRLADSMTFPAAVGL